MAALGMHQFDALFGPQYPPPLQPTRQIQLVRTKIDMVGRCVSCLRSTGSLTCSRCWAVKYCSKDCQQMGGLMDRRRGWKDHKEICNKIRTLSKEAVAAGEALEQEFGGAETFFKTQLVKKGLFKYIEEYDDKIEPGNANEKYILARGRLISAYVRCGKESHSSVAFRLAAENMLDLLCLTYRKAEGEHVRYTYCGWMVAGGMDQEALTYLCYFRHRKLSARPLPYLDLSTDEDIEGETYIDLLKTKKDRFDWSTHQWFHDYMLIALIKYKRLQSLLVQKQKAEAGWNTFMMGTHPRVGKKSVVLKMRGKTLIVERIKSMVLSDNFGPRVDQLTEQIQKILSEVNLKNPLIIPGILDRNCIPKDPVYDEEDVDKDTDDEDEDEDDEDGHGDNIHDACWAYGNYASAWLISHAYTRVLKLFLDTGRVAVSTGKYGTIPVEGFLQAAFDTDPSRYYGRKDDLFIGLSSI